MGHGRVLFSGLFVLVGCGGGEATPATTGPTATPPAPVASITIEPSALTLGIGQAAQLSATTRDATGNALSNRVITWSTSSQSVASVSATGVVTAVAVGTAQITATSEGKSASAAITVPAPVVSTLRITGAGSVFAGQSTKLSAQTLDADGNVITGKTIAWSSSSTDTASISGDGTVVGNHPGVAVITATADGKAASKSVRVSAAPFTYTYDIATTGADKKLVEDATTLARTFFQKTFNRTIERGVSISTSTNDTTCARVQATAYAGAGQFVVCLSSSGWKTTTDILKQKVIVHELFHVLQYEVGWLSKTAPIANDWLVEGSAEYVGFSAISDSGLLPFSTGKSCNVWNAYFYNKQNTPAFPSLSTLEAPSAFLSVPGPNYAFALLGVDLFVTPKGLRSLRTFWDALSPGGANWASSFQSTFGLSPQSFYSQYDTMITQLQPPARYECN